MSKTNDVAKAAQATQFQHWLAHMHVALADFIQTLPGEVSSRLDGSPASLNVLEAWLLDRYATVAQARPPSEASVIDGAARYVGEVFRAVTDSKWSIQLDEPKALFFGLPILVGGKFGSMPDCPMTMVTASLDRRTGKYLSGIVANFSD